MGNKISLREAARRVGVYHTTLKSYSDEGLAPSYVQVGPNKKVLYDEDEIAEWLEESRNDNEQEEANPAS